MSIRQDRLSDIPYPEEYETPDERSRATALLDYEKGPIALNDSSAGMQYQDWALEFNSGNFTVTAETSGYSGIVLSGQDAIQCSLCFDQNAHVMLAWVDSSYNGNIYWFDIFTGQFEILIFETPVTSVALTLDDKRPREVGVNDMLLWYTLPTIVAGEYDLYHRLQRDRFLTAYPMKSATYPYIKKCGMNHGLRVQLTLGTVNL